MPILDSTVNTDALALKQKVVKYLFIALLVVGALAAVGGFCYAVGITWHDVLHPFATTRPAVGVLVTPDGFFLTFYPHLTFYIIL